MIRIEGLRKEFDGFTALEGVSLSIGDGETLLVLGPNGSGKSTLFRCMLGILRFDGLIEVNGMDVRRNAKEVREVIGYVPQSPGLPAGMTARQVVRFHSRLHGIDLDEEELLGRFGLGDVVDVPIAEFSGGMKQRLALALAISHDPGVLVLDEPLANLDHEGREIFLDLLDECKRDGKTVIMSAHRISDVLIRVDRVLMLIEGRVVYHGPIEAVLKRIGLVKIHLRIDEGVTLPEIKAGRPISKASGWLTIECEDIVGLMAELASSGIRVKGIIAEEPSLDELVSGMIGERDGIQG